MKSMLLILMLSMSLFAAEVKKEEPKKEEAQPVPIFGAPNKLAMVDPKTGQVTLEKGAKPEDVYHALISIIQSNKAAYEDLSKKLAACEKPEKKK